MSEYLQHSKCIKCHIIVYYRIFGILSATLCASLCLQPWDWEWEGAAEDDDSSNPHRICAGAVSARTAGRIHRTPRLPVETAGASISPCSCHWEFAFPVQYEIASWTDYVRVMCLRRHLYLSLWVFLFVFWSQSCNFRRHNDWNESKDSVRDVVTSFRETETCEQSKVKSGDLWKENLHILKDSC